MFTLVTILISCYLLIVIFVFFYQRSLLYHPSENNYTSEKANFNYEEVYIPTSDGKKLKAWFHKKDLKQIIEDKSNDTEMIDMAKKDLNELEIKKG